MASLLNMSGGSLLNKGLPYDAEIEYLESSGTQWIDTEIFGDLNTESKITFTFKEVGFCLFGTRKNATEKNFSALIGSNSFAYIDMLNYKQSRCSQQVTRNVIYTVYIDKRKRSISSNGQIINSNTNILNTPFTTERTLKIGYTDPLCSWYGLPINLKGKVYDCYIKKNDVLVRDFIPVRVGQVGYMYDKVSGQLFGNAGTGAFILGADK